MQPRRQRMRQGQRRDSAREGSAPARRFVGTTAWGRHVDHATAVGAARWQVGGTEDVPAGWWVVCHRRIRIRGCGCCRRAVALCRHSQGWPWPLIRLIAGFVGREPDTAGVQPGQPYAR